VYVAALRCVDPPSVEPYQLSIHPPTHPYIHPQPFVDLGRFFSFLMLYTVGRTPCTWDQPVARPLPTHRTTQTDIHALSGTRTHDLSVRASEDSSCLRLRDQYDLHQLSIRFIISEVNSDCNLPKESVKVEQE
jgi:hypothetical protein